MGKEERLTEAVRRYLELRPGFFQVDVRTGDGRLIEGKKGMGLSHYQIFFAGRQPCFMPKWRRNRL